MSLFVNILFVFNYIILTVHLLSSSWFGVDCILSQGKVFLKWTQQVLPITRYRLNILDYNNNIMGSFDIADQLRNVYRYDSQWHRNRKWLWSIWWWGYHLFLKKYYIFTLNFTVWWVVRMFFHVTTSSMKLVCNRFNSTFTGLKHKWKQRKLVLTLQGYFSL